MIFLNSPQETLLVNDVVRLSNDLGVQDHVVSQEQNGLTLEEIAKSLPPQQLDGTEIKVSIGRKSQQKSVMVRDIDCTIDPYGQAKIVKRDP